MRGRDRATGAVNQRRVSHVRFHWVTCTPRRGGVFKWLSSAAASAWRTGVVATLCGVRPGGFRAVGRRLSRFLSPLVMIKLTRHGRGNAVTFTLALVVFSFAPESANYAATVVMNNSTREYHYASPKEKKRTCGPFTPEF